MPGGAAQKWDAQRLFEMYRDPDNHETSYRKSHGLGREDKYFCRLIFASRRGNPPRSRA
jgi:hypothetical protein